MPCFSLQFFNSSSLIQEVEQVPEEMLTKVKKEITLWKTFLKELVAHEESRVISDFISVAEEIEKDSIEGDSLYFICKDNDSVIQAVARCTISYRNSERSFKVKQILSAPWNIQKIMKKVGRKVYTRGCGVIMLHALFHVAKRWGLQRLFLFSTTSAEGFYRKIGMHPYETSGFTFATFDSKDVCSINAAAKRALEKKGSYTLRAPSTPLSQTSLSF